LIDELGRKEEDRDRAATVSAEENPTTAAERKIRSRKSTSAPSSRTTSIPVTARA